MKRITTYLLFLITYFVVMDCQAQERSALSPRIANYTMEVELDVETKKLHGQTTLIWKNIGTKPTDHLLFHLYYNAFKNSNSTFFKERGFPGILPENIDEECGWGWTKITSVTDPDGNDLSTNMTYIQPDDGNFDDQTVVRLALGQSVKPGESFTLTYEWMAKVPKTMPRTGYNKDYYFFSQWFPKVGVYEPTGMRYAVKDTWSCHQYHSNGEYYSDFGIYEVSMTLPENYVVAASGRQTALSKEKGKKTWTFIAEDVIDFTWSASPQFAITEDKYKATEIRLYSYPEKQVFADRYLPILKFSMEYLEQILGPYPYPTLSVVDPPIFGLYTGGMEYPTLITSLSSRIIPSGIKTTETLIVHEFIHQYFMQMVASNESEEPWLDEGLTSYFEGRILDAYLGEKTSAVNVMGLKAGNREWNRAEFFNSEYRQVASNIRKSWEYNHGGYAPISYNKTALWLETMEGLLGRNTMNDIFKTYFERWKFKHPARQDFVSIVNELVRQNHADTYPQGFDWYFEQVLYGTGLCDYKVANISNELIKEQRGFFSDLEDCNTTFQNTGPIYKSSVILHRLGELKVPIEFLVVTDDKDNPSTVYHWDGKERSHELVLNGNSNIISVTIDPDNKLPLDHDLLNNSMTVSRQDGILRSLSARFITGFQHILEIVSLLV